MYIYVHLRFYIHFIINKNLILIIITSFKLNAAIYHLISWHGPTPFRFYLFQNNSTFASIHFINMFHQQTSNEKDMENYSFLYAAEYRLLLRT